MPDRTRRSRRSGATGRVTSTVVLVTIPWRWAARMPSLTPRVSPKSSAFTMSRRTSVPRGSLDQETLDRARRVRADEVEALARDGRVAVAEPRVDGDAVQEGVLPDRGDRRRQHVGRHHARAGPGRQDRGEPEAGADLQYALARTHAEVPLEEARAGLGRLDTVRDAEEAARDGVEEDAVVGHYAVYTARMSAWAFAALARIAKLIASRTSSSVAPARLAPARSRLAQWVLPTARFAAR